MPDIRGKGQAALATAMRWWGARASALPAIRARADAMGRHAARRLMNPDRELSAAMAASWERLPPELRSIANNISTIRLGAIGYAFVLPASIASTARTSTPAEFARYIVGFTPVAGALGLVAVAVILHLRATRTSRHFVDAYKLLLPDMAERIEAVYGEPGLGDVVAPWIRGRRRLGGEIARRIAARFRLLP